MKDFDLAILDIRLQKWIVPELIPHDSKQEIKINVDTNIGTDPKKGIVILTIGVECFLAGSPDKNIVEAAVQTIYKIQDGTNNPEFMEMPDQGIISMISIAISHCRAVIAQQSKDFGLNIVLPLINPSVIFDQMKSKLNLSNK